MLRKQPLNQSTPILECSVLPNPHKPAEEYQSESGVSSCHPQSYRNTKFPAKIKITIQTVATIFTQED